VGVFFLNTVYNQMVSVSCSTVAWFRVPIVFRPHRRCCQMSFIISVKPQHYC